MKFSLQVYHLLSFTVRALYTIYTWFLCNITTDMHHFGLTCEILVTWGHSDDTKLFIWCCQILTAQTWEARTGFLFRLFFIFLLITLQVNQTLNRGIKYEASHSWAFSLPCKQTDMSPLLKSLPPNHECNSCTKWSFGLFHSNIIISARLLIRLQSSMSKDFLQSLYLDWLNGNTFLWHIGPIQYWFIC